MRHGLEKEHLLKLTLAAYKVTAIFPVEEELGLKIRESADKILAGLLLNKSDENCSRLIKEILGLFDLAEKKNLVDSRNLAVLRSEYDIVGHAISNLFDNQNGNRREKILEVVSGNGVVKIGDLVKLFPGVNRRTVLRDLDKLCQTGMMVRGGNGRGVHYIKNGHNHTKCDIVQKMSQ